MQEPQSECELFAPLLPPDVLACFLRCLNDLLKMTLGQREHPKFHKEFPAIVCSAIQWFCDVSIHEYTQSVHPHNSQDSQSAADGGNSSNRRKAALGDTHNQGDTAANNQGDTAANDRKRLCTACSADNLCEFCLEDAKARLWHTAFCNGASLGEETLTDVSKLMERTELAIRVKPISHRSTKTQRVYDLITRGGARGLRDLAEDDNTPTQQREPIPDRLLVFVCIQLAYRKLNARGGSAIWLCECVKKSISGTNEDVISILGKEYDLQAYNSAFVHYGLRSMHRTSSYGVAFVHTMSVSALASLLNHYMSRCSEDLTVSDRIRRCFVIAQSFCIYAGAKGFGLHQTAQSSQDMVHSVIYTSLHICGFASEAKAYSTHAKCETASLVFREKLISVSERSPLQFQAILRCVDTNCPSVSDLLHCDCVGCN